MGKKYELVKEDTIQIDGHTLYRIRALKTIKSAYFIREGDLGGYIESEDNLSQEGNGWVAEDAQVYGDIKIGNDMWAKPKCRWNQYHCFETYSYCIETLKEKHYTYDIKKENNMKKILFKILSTLKNIVLIQIAIILFTCIIILPPSALITWLVTLIYNHF